MPEGIAVADFYVLLSVTLLKNNVRNFKCLTLFNRYQISMYRHLQSSTHNCDQGKKNWCILRHILPPFAMATSSCSGRYQDLPYIRPADSRIKLIDFGNATYAPLALCQYSSAAVSFCSISLGPISKQILCEKMRKTKTNRLKHIETS